ncbi:MAG: copper resistance protein B [Bdellovibrionota bacterium]
MKTRRCFHLGRAVLLSLSTCGALSCSYFHAGMKPQSSVVQNDRPDSELTAPLPEDYHSPPLPPAPGQAIRKYASDQPGPGPYNFGIKPMEDDKIFSTVLVDRLEYRRYKSADQTLWDVTGWSGNDYSKLFIESEGVTTLGGPTEDADLQVLYSRNIAPYWDLQIGPRYAFSPEDGRFFGVLGIEGRAPQWFEIEANVYVSEDADLTADADVEYDLLLSQRLILQPRAEIKAAAQTDRAHDQGDGLREFGLGLRLRYEITRKFAPYIGVSWERSVGEQAHFAESAGEDADALFWLAGMRVWF